ncbi:MAG: cysteine desulfurase [Chloroflexia bacterium]|nr:cysteine desulfurase [Chloroflexia bacterium]
MATPLLSPAPLQVDAIRADFPILNQANERGQRLVYLDSAASSQKPAVVIDAQANYYRHDNANIHRGVYALSERATTEYETARKRVAAFINAPDPDTCIFVRNTTEAINLVAYSWGRQHIQAGDLLVVTLLDHHSNLVPWQVLAETQGAELAYARVTAGGRLDEDHLGRLLDREPKLVAMPHVSNALGTIVDVARWTRRAQAAGATVLIDGAQSAPHLPVDVAAIGCDFFALSGHKLLAPMGSGVLWGKRDRLDAMPPFLTGGGMIRRVTVDGTTWAELPAKFEAGTPAVGEAIGLGVAVDYLTELGMDRVRSHERDLTDYALDRLQRLPGIQLYGPDDLDERAGVISFAVGEVHPHDVASILAEENVAVRAGHHCCQPLMRELDLVATTRASFSVYNDETDVDRLASAIERVIEVFA